MQLFFSFIMRATMFLLKDSLFVAGVGLRFNITFSGEGIPLYPEYGIDCKIFTSFWHYFLMANYSWILMEGVYLHNLVFLAMFTDSSSILGYVLLGWGLPVVSILPWIIVRATLEDTLCWTTNQHPGYFWIIRGPITIAILVNFVLFLNVARVVFTKMFSSQTSHFRRYKYSKWFRSTLVLVPLFGVHYTVLLGMAFFAGNNKTVEVVWLYVDQFFSSFQGSFVAFLYCFLNGEVQSEVWKIWTKWKMSYVPHYLQSQPSMFSQSTTHLSRGRNSSQSLPSTYGTDLKKHFNENKATLESASPSPLLTPARSADRRNTCKFYVKIKAKKTDYPAFPSPNASRGTSDDSRASLNGKTTPDVSRSQSLSELRRENDSLLPDSSEELENVENNLKTFFRHSFKRAGSLRATVPATKSSVADARALLKTRSTVRESSF